MRLSFELCCNPIFSGEDDDFFSTGKPSQPKPAKTAAPSVAPPTTSLSPDSDDLFNDDPLFGGGVSKSTAPPTKPSPKETKKQEPAVKKRPPSNDLFASSPEPDKPSEDSDDLFSSKSKPPPAKTSPQVSKAKSTPPVKKQASPQVVKKKTKPAATSGGLFGGSDDSEDDLFSDPKPKKPSQPKTTAKSARQTDDLFSDDPFESSTSSVSKAKPKTVTTKQKETSDDLFSDPLASTPPVKAAAPATKPKQPTTSARPPANDDDLFSDPLSGSAPPTSLPGKKAKQSDDLFSGDPLLAGMAPPRTKAKPIKTSDDLFDDPLATSPSSSLAAPPPKTKAKPSARTGSHDLFSDEPDVEPEPAPKVEVVPAKKKPAGAVSMFGGIDPFAAAKGRGGGGKDKSHDQVKPRLSSSPSQADKKDSLFGKKDVHVKDSSTTLDFFKGERVPYPFS